MNEQEQVLRVVVADDHPMFREGLAATIASLPGKKVVGQAATGLEAIELAQQAQPDVVVMDLHMPHMNGIDATRHITQAHPQVAVLVLTMLEDDASVVSAMQAGARGYLLKEANRAEIARALEAVAAGEVIFGPSVAARVLSLFNTTPDARRPGQAAFPELTEREQEILELVARGLSNPAIASRLFLSEKTVRNHVSNVFTKLHVTDRAAAVARARDRGYGLNQGSTHLKPQQAP
jgi:DNA-binding NarL/FixJ family response regulator